MGESPDVFSFNRRTRMRREIQSKTTDFVGITPQLEICVRRAYGIKSKVLSKLFRLRGIYPIPRPTPNYLY